MPQEFNWDRFYQKLNIIFNGIIAISMLPFAIVFLDIQKNDPPSLMEGAAHSGLKISLMFLSMAFLGLSNWWWRRNIGAARKEETLELKLKTYLSIKLKHLFILELAAIMGCVGYYLLKEFIFVIIYLGILFIFSNHRPRFSRVCKDINVEEDELVSWVQQD